MTTRKSNRKSKKSNKRFRKTRSKRQSGGNPSVNGCTETLVVYVTIVVGLSHLTDDMGVSIFPNPNSGAFDIIFENYSGQATMEVGDMAGRLVYKDVKSGVVGESYHVTLLSASNGVYFLNIMSETGIHSVRIIKR